MKFTILGLEIRYDGPAWRGWVEVACGLAGLACLVQFIISLIR